MKTRTIQVGDLRIGGGNPLAVIAGPCVIESREVCLQIARRLKEIGQELGMSIIFKAAFDKSNRISVTSFRGLGMEQGLEILAEVKAETELPVHTDFHVPDQALRVAQVCDVLQVPAYLCRQTDMLTAAGRTRKPVFIKKGQFMNPADMKFAAQKVESEGNDQVFFGERGTFFGYGNQVVDMRSLPLMRKDGYAVVYDATHSVQRPGGAGGSSGGDPELIAPMARAAVAAGVDGVFFEVHPDPPQALCDAASMLPLGQFPALLRQLKQLDALRASFEEEE